MRRLFALVCCAVHVVFGLVTGMAHVHEAADHDQELRLHLDHAHLGAASGHGSRGHHEPARSDDGAPRLAARPSGHHAGEALYLTGSAQRYLDPGLRLSPALLAGRAPIDLPVRISVCPHAAPDHPRGPPSDGPTRPRAPPV